jgi:o-succinylbenzoate synthase
VRVTVTEHLLPLIAPLETSHGMIERRVVWMLALEDEAGRVGLGEAAPLPAFGGEDPMTCQEILGDMLPILDEDFILSWLTRGRADAALGIRLERLLAKAPCARSAVEGALIDLLAQRENLSVAECLAGGPGLDRVPVNALISGSLPEIERVATERLAEGYTSFKLKIGGDVFADARRLRALRQCVGTEASIRVDANGAWDRKQAQFFLESAREQNLEFCEQLIHPDDLSGLAQLRKATGVLIAADEAIRQPSDVARLASAQAVDIVCLKPMFLGGWRPTRQAAELAHSQGVEVVLTSAIDGCVGRAHATHMAAALGLGRRAQGLATGRLLAADLTANPLRPVRGAIPIPDTPGLGIGATSLETRR